VINVSGRTYPVEVRYRPYQLAENEESKSLQQGIIDAVNELSKIDRGDILVFLSGERDIRETTEALSKEAQRMARSVIWQNTEVLPLLARLSSAEQNRFFIHRTSAALYWRQRGGNFADRAGHQICHRFRCRPHSR